MRYYQNDHFDEKAGSSNTILALASGKTGFDEILNWILEHQR